MTFGDLNFTTIRFLFFGDVDLKNVLVSFRFVRYRLLIKTIISYLYNGNRVKPLHIMLPKTSAYVKSYDEQTKWIYFLIQDVD